MFTWGDNKYGQLGQGNYDTLAVPTMVSQWGEAGEVRVVGLSASGYHAGVVVVGGEDKTAKTNFKKMEKVSEGVFLLHDPVGACMDVVFVGENLMSWTSEDGSLWPRDWLSNDFPVLNFFLSPLSSFPSY